MHWKIPALAVMSLAWLCACAGNKYEEQKPVAALDLDSLNRVNLHNDSAEANLFFYEQAFEEYRDRFPGVDKQSYMRIAKGQDRDFCLFHPDPAAACLDIGGKLEALGLMEPACEAYEAGLLSEGANGWRMNVRLWASLGRIYFGKREFEKGKPFLAKVLEVQPGHLEAKKLLASVPRPKAKG